MRAVGGGTVAGWEEIAGYEEVTERRKAYLQAGASVQIY